MKYIETFDEPDQTPQRVRIAEHATEAKAVGKKQRMAGIYGVPVTIVVHQHEAIPTHVFFVQVACHF